MTDTITSFLLSFFANNGVACEEITIVGRVEEEELWRNIARRKPVLGSLELVI
jgi:hypothetical protein